MYAVRVRAYQLYTETPYMARIRGGPIVTNMFEQMLRKQTGELSRNFAIYSAHDTTLNFAMTALNVINQTAPIPDFGATLCLELYCDDGSGDCAVNVGALSSPFASHNFHTYNSSNHNDYRWYTISTPPRPRQSNWRFRIALPHAASANSELPLVIFEFTISQWNANWLQQMNNFYSGNLTAVQT